MLSLIELQRKKVEAKRKKYDKDEMDSYLELVFENYKELLNQNKQLEAEKSELNQKVKKLSDGVQYYRSIETTLQKALILAEKTSKETKDAALMKAEAIEKDANKRADEIIRNAEGEYSKIKGKCIHLVQQFTQYKNRLIEAASAQLELVEGDEFDIEAPKEYSQTSEPPVKQEQSAPSPAPAPTPTPVPEPAPVPEPVMPKPAPAPAPAPVVSEPAPVSNPVVPEPAPVSNPVVPEPAPVSDPVVPEPALVSDPVVPEPVSTIDTIASGQLSPNQEDELASASLKPERTAEEILQADTIDLRNTLDAIQAFEQKNTLDLDLQPITPSAEEQGKSDMIGEQQPEADLIPNDFIEVPSTAEPSLASIPDADAHIDTAGVKNIQPVEAAFVEPVQAKTVEPLDAMFEAELAAGEERSKNTEKLDPPAKEPETVPTLDALLQDLNINNKSNQKSDDPFEFLGSIDDDF